MQGVASDPGGHGGGRRLRLGVCVVTAALAAAIGGAVLIATTSGVDDAGAQAGDPADLSLTKSDSPDPASENSALTYTLAVQNAGPDPATNVAVRDDLPGQVDPRSAEASAGNCEIQGRNVNCELGTIASGDQATVTIEVTTKKARQIMNTATVESEVEDPQSANNTDSETTTVVEAEGGARCKKKPVTVPAGTDASETINGTEKRDVIVARGGNDQINAGGGKDVICAGRGSDVVRAGGGNDLAKGQRGRDLLRGQSGGDTLRGNRGRDKLRGGRGNDLLAGGKGRDRCKGGRGNDTERRSCER